MAVPGGGLQSAEVRGSGRQWRDRGGVGRLSPGEIKTHRTWRQIKVGDVGRREGGAEHLGKGRRAVEERAGRLAGCEPQAGFGTDEFQGPSGPLGHWRCESGAQRWSFVSHLHTGAG